MKFFLNESCSIIGLLAFSVTFLSPCQPFQPNVARFVPEVFLFRNKSAGREVLLTRFCTNEETKVEIQEFNQGKKLGLLALASVPLMWGTYTPTVKFMENMGSEFQPPGLLFNSSCYFVSCIVLLTVQLVIHFYQLREGQNSISTVSRGVWTASDESQGCDSLVHKKSRDSLDWKLIVRAGFDLGGWLFIGSTLQIYGLQFTTASKAAFLVQTTTVIVPIIESIVKQTFLNPEILKACVLATLGILVLSLGDSLITTFNSHVPMNELQPFVKGDLLVGASAIFYSFHVVRLGMYASKIEPITLAASKAVAQLTYSAILMPIFFYFGHTDNVYRFVANISENKHALSVVVAVCLWNGIITTAYTLFAQSFGQRQVSPSTANLIYSSQPLWSALFATVFLKEAFSPIESIGAAVLVGAIFLSLQQFRDL